MFLVKEKTLQIVLSMISILTALPVNHAARLGDVSVSPLLLPSFNYK